jgi:hypothetical protein
MKGDKITLSSKLKKKLTFNLEIMLIMNLKEKLRKRILNYIEDIVNLQSIENY